MQHWVNVVMAACNRQRTSEQHTSDVDNFEPVRQAILEQHVRLQVPPESAQHVLYVEMQHASYAAAHAAMSMAVQGSCVAAAVMPWHMAMPITTRGFEWLMRPCNLSIPSKFLILMGPSQVRHIHGQHTHMPPMYYIIICLPSSTINTAGVQLFSRI